MNVTPYNFRKAGPLASDLEYPVLAWLRTASGLATHQWAKVLPFAAELRVEHLDAARTEEAVRDRKSVV